MNATAHGSDDAPIRVLLAKVGLDGHDRGVKVVARALRDAGMEVVYTGLHRSPEEIVATAVQEDVDVIGVSLLSGAHMTLFPMIIDQLREQGILERYILIGGGVMPDEDVDALMAMGVKAILGQDTPPDAGRRHRSEAGGRAGSSRLMEQWSWPPAYDDSYMPAPDQEYWFPVRETMDPEERDAAILVRLREVMTYAYERSPFYRRKWDAAGVDDPRDQVAGGLRAGAGDHQGGAAAGPGRAPAVRRLPVHPRERGGTGPRHLGHHRPAHGLRHRPG